MGDGDGKLIKPELVRLTEREAGLVYARARDNNRPRAAVIRGLVRQGLGLEPDDRKRTTIPKPNEQERY